MSVVDGSEVQDEKKIRCSVKMRAIEESVIRRGKVAEKMKESIVSVTAETVLPWQVRGMLPRGRSCSFFLDGFLVEEACMDDP